MIELRWALQEHTTTQAPRLQYRQLPAIVSFGGPGWGEWQDVPFVVVPTPIAAGTSMHPSCLIQLKDPQ